MSQDTSVFISEYLKIIALRMQERACKDSFGKPVTGLSETEASAVGQFIKEMAKCAGGPLRCALELEPGVRKNVLLFGGVLQLIKEQAGRAGRNILYLTADGAAKTRATLDLFDMSRLTVGTLMQILTWDDLEPKPENGLRQTDLGPYWIIGDLDTTAPLEPNRFTTAKIDALQRVLTDGACPALLLHRKGDVPLIPFPLSFSDEPAASSTDKPAAKSACFIATAACGSPMAEEVELLRDFRDTVLAPRAAGRAFVAIYECFSPPLAQWIAARPQMRKAVRCLIILPLARALHGKRITQLARRETQLAKIIDSRIGRM